MMLVYLFGTAYQSKIYALATLPNQAPNIMFTFYGLTISIRYSVLGIQQAQQKSQFTANIPF